MPALAALFGGFVIAVMGFFAKWMTKRIAIIGAAIVGLVALTGTFVAAIEGIMAGISYTAPDFAGVFLFLPSNFSACFSAMIAARIAHWVYSWNVAIIQMKLF